MAASAEIKSSAAEDIVATDTPTKNQLSWQAVSAQRHSIIRRLGRSTMAILVTTILLSFLILGFLSFLWHGNSESGVWHKIMVSGWATRAVTIPTLILRTAVDLQAGVAAAMIAALVLERGPVPVADVAMWSIARASKTRPRTLLFPSMRSRKLEMMSWTPIVAIVILCVTTIILQLSSTILLSDFGSGVLRTFPSQAQLLYDYIYPVIGIHSNIPGGWALPTLGLYPQKHRTTTWLRNPPEFPAFAEYSMPAKPQGQHVDDTGTLLRAFLPYADSGLRQRLSKYTGKSLVLDSRVSCQPPGLTDLAVSEIAGIAYSFIDWRLVTKSYTILQINGTLQPSERYLDRLWAPDLAIPFTCYAGVGNNSTSMCQLNAPPRQPLSNMWNQVGGLLSEFSNVTNITELEQIAARQTKWNGYDLPAYITWGTPLLVFQAVNSGSILMKQDPFWNTTFFGGPPIPLQNASISPEVDSDGVGPWTVIKSNINWHPWRLRASLCYTAWSTATLEVTMGSEKTLTEPTQHWDPKSGLYTTPRVTEQLLSTSNLSKSDRQILTLRGKSSWVPLPEDVGPINAMPFVQAYADLSGISLSPDTGMTGNYTTIMTKDSFTQEGYGLLPEGAPVKFADDTLVWLFDSVMENSSSIAHSVSALITVLSGMAYYDQLPRFQAVTNATQVFFTDVLFPQNFGGYWTIIITVAVHTALVIAVTAVFMKRSQVSFVGNHWHAVIQLVSSQTVSLFEGNSVSTDHEMRRQLRITMASDSAAQLMPMEDGQSAQLAIKTGLQCSDVLREANSDHNLEPQKR